MTARIIAILLTLGIAVPAIRAADWAFEGNAAFSAAQLVQALARQRLDRIFAAAVRQATRAPFGRLRFVESAELEKSLREFIGRP